MPAPKIISYYLLCSVRMGGRKHIVSAAPLTAVFTKSQIDLFLLPAAKDIYVARETVVGGAATSKRGRVVIIN